ncbi:MAG: T9SS type A sorting domain-containing protein [Bacteroidota bacterium]
MKIKLHSSRLMQSGFAFLLMFFLFTGSSANAQIYEPEGLNMPGAWNGWENPPSNLALASFTQVSGGRVTKISTGTTRWQTIFSVAASGGDITGGSYEWLFTSGSTGNPWGNKWANVSVSMNTLQTYTFNSGANNQITVVDGKWYSMNWKDSGYTGTQAIFMETSAQPVNLTSLSVPSSVPANQAAEITLTTSASPAAEEIFYLRYTTNNWISSALLTFSMSGSEGTATIPAQGPGAVVDYYAFSSTVGSISADFDLYTIKSSSSYSYTVSGLSTQAEILGFTLSLQTGAAVINSGAATVGIEVAYGTDVTALSPTITVSALATIDPASGVTRDFTNPVTYTVTSESTSQKVWTVTVTIAAPPVIGWANLQWPPNGNIDPNQEFFVYSQVYADGVTAGAGQGAGMQAWIGYSTENTNPDSWMNWIVAPYFGEVGSNDEYQTNLGQELSAGGTYYYASRFKLGSGPYIYGGYNGGYWDGSNNVSGVLTVNFPATSTWTGATDSDWADADNWSNGVPGPGTDVTIPAGLTNYPTLTAAGVCNNFTIQSNATGTGSIIGNEFLTVGGTTAIERYISAYTSETTADGWHLISSPVINQAISGDWTPTSTGYDFFALDESKPYEYWLNQKNHPEMVSFGPGKGYLTAYAVTGVKTFSDLMTYAVVTVSGLTNTPGSAYPGWHLVGNPFASAINAAGLVRTNIDPVVQVWSSADASYKTSTEVGNIIPSMNGFMVHSTGNGELSIPVSSRVHSNTNWYKSGEEMILLKANDIAGHMSQSSLIRFNSVASEGFDTEFDSYFLAGFAPMFYSKSGDAGFALNTLPELTNETVIPFEFVKNSSSEFSIELVQSIPGSIVFLTDKKTNAVINLSQIPLYNFSSIEGDVADRFLLTFAAVGIDNPEAGKVNIYGYRDIVYINGASTGSEVTITNLLGQVMKNSSVNGGGLHTIDGSALTDGIYLVNVISGNSVVSKKVVLEK